MPETNFLAADQAAVKKPKKSARGGSASGGKAVRKKKTNKPLLQSSEILDTNLAVPKFVAKVKENVSNVKKREARNVYPVKNNISNGVYRKIAFSFVALTIILILAALYFGFSKVTLVIVPVQEKITDNVSLEIVDKDGATAADKNQISGIVRQVSVEQSRTFTASGKEVLGEEVSGKVTIINNYMKNQPLVATTRLLSQDNKLFRLKNTVNVPAGGKVDAEVYADEAKSDMAIGPSKFTIPGLWAGLQDKIYAQSQEPMKYSEKIKHIIKQSDIDDAVSELKKELLTNAKKEVGRVYQEYNQSILEVDNNSITQEVQGKVGEERENFTIKMKTKLTVVAFKDEDIYGRAKAKLAVRLADDKEVLEFSQPETTYSLGNLNLSQGIATVNVNFVAKVTLKNSARIIKKSNLAGMDAKQIAAYLSSLPEVAGYEIKFFPSFIKKIPNLVDRIEIVIKK